MDAPEAAELATLQCDELLPEPVASIDVAQAFAPQLSPGNLRKLQDDIIALRAQEWSQALALQQKEDLCQELRSQLQRALSDRDEVRYCIRNRLRNASRRLVAPHTHIHTLMTAQSCEIMFTMNIFPCLFIIDCYVQIVDKCTVLQQRCLELDEEKQRSCYLSLMLKIQEADTEIALSKPPVLTLADTTTKSHVAHSQQRMMVHPPFAPGGIGMYFSNVEYYVFAKGSR